MRPQLLGGPLDARHSNAAWFSPLGPNAASLARPAAGRARLRRWHARHLGLQAAEQPAATAAVVAAAATVGTAAAAAPAAKSPAAPAAGAAATAGASPGLIEKLNTCTSWEQLQVSLAHVTPQHARQAGAAVARAAVRAAELLPLPAGLQLDHHQQHQQQQQQQPHHHQQQQHSPLHQQLSTSPESLALTVLELVTTTWGRLPGKDLPAVLRAIPRLQAVAAGSGSGMEQQLPLPDAVATRPLPPVHITTAICSCRDTADLEAVISGLGMQLNHVHATAAAVRLARLTEAATAWGGAAGDSSGSAAERCHAAVEAVLLREGAELAPNEVAQALWALGKLQTLLPGPQQQQQQQQQQGLDARSRAALHSQLLQAFLDTLGSLGPKEVTMGLHGVANLRLPVPQRAAAALVGAARRALPASGPREMANTAWALARMEQQSEVVAAGGGAAAAAAAAAASRSESTQWGPLLAPWVGEFVRASRPHLVPAGAALPAAHRSGNGNGRGRGSNSGGARGFNTQELASVIWALAQLRADVPSAWLAAAEAAASPRLGDCDQQQLAMVCWGMSRMGRVPGREFADRAAAAAQLLLPRATAQSLSLLLHAAARHRRWPSVGWVDELWGLMRDHAASDGEAECEGLTGALSVLGLDSTGSSSSKGSSSGSSGGAGVNSNTFAGGAAGGVESDAAVPDAARVGLVMSGTSSNSSSSSSPVWLQAALRQSVRQLRSGSARDVAMLLWSVARSKQRPGNAWVATALGTAAQRLPQCTQQGVAMIAWAAGRLQQRPSAGSRGGGGASPPPAQHTAAALALLSALQAETRRHLPAMTPYELTCVVWGTARLAAANGAALGDPHGCSGSSAGDRALGGGASGAPLIEPQWGEAVAARARDLLPEMDPAQASALLLSAALVRGSPASGRLLEAVLDPDRLSLAAWPPRELSALLRACAACDRRPPAPVMQRVLVATQRHLGALSPKMLASVGWGVAKQQQLWYRLRWRAREAARTARRTRRQAWMERQEQLQRVHGSGGGGPLRAGSPQQHAHPAPPPGAVLHGEQLHHAPANGSSGNGAEGHDPQQQHAAADGTPPRMRRAQRAEPSAPQPPVWWVSAYAAACANRMPQMNAPHLTAAMWALSNMGAVACSHIPAPSNRSSSSGETTTTTSSSSSSSTGTAHAAPGEAHAHAPAVLDDALLALVYRRSEQLLGSYTGPQIACIMHSLARMGALPPAGWVDRHAARASALLPGLGPQSLAELSAALAAWDWAPPAWWSRRFVAIAAPAAARRGATGWQLRLLGHSLAALDPVGAGPQWPEALAAARAEAGLGSNIGSGASVRA